MPFCTRKFGNKEVIKLCVLWVCLCALAGCIGAGAMLFENIKYTTHTHTERAEHGRRVAVWVAFAVRWQTTELEASVSFDRVRENHSIRLYFLLLLKQAKDRKA